MPVKDETQLSARIAIKPEYKKENNKTVKLLITLSIFLILVIEGLSIVLIKNYHELYMNTLQLVSYDLELLILSSNLLFYTYYFKKCITTKIAYLSFIVLILSNIVSPFLDFDYKTYLFWFQSLALGGGLASLLIGVISWRMKSQE